VHQDSIRFCFWEKKTCVLGHDLNFPEFESISSDDFWGIVLWYVEFDLYKILEQSLLICVGFHRFSWPPPFLFVSSGCRSLFVDSVRSQLGVGIGRSNPVDPLQPSLAQSLLAMTGAGIA
jgi:hypothetical protein